MNWKNEAMEKLRHYDAMRLALENIPRELTRLEGEACSIRASRMDGTPVKGGSGREEMLLNNLTQRQQLTWRLEQTKLWVRNVERGLSALNPEEKLVLTRLYIYPERGAVERLCGELGVEQSSIYAYTENGIGRCSNLCWRCTARWKNHKKTRLSAQAGFYQETSAVL